MEKVVCCFVESWKQFVIGKTHTWTRRPVRFRRNVSSKTWRKKNQEIRTRRTSPFFTLRSSGKASNVTEISTHFQNNHFYITHIHKIIESLFSNACFQKKKIFERVPQHIRPLKLAKSAIFTSSKNRKMKKNVKKCVRA